MPAVAELAAELVASLHANGDPARAVTDQTYLKLELPFAGLGVPECRRLARNFVRTHSLDRLAVIALADELWATPLFEAKRIAMEILSMRVDVLEPPDLAFVERLLRASDTWALVDHLAINVAGPLVEREGADALDRWATDEDFWVRRAALLALYVPIREGAGDAERFLRYADAMLDEREFFIRKAIGWVLRDMGRRRPALVREWLVPRARRASGLTIREAVKWLPAEDAQAVLAARH